MSKKFVNVGPFRKSEETVEAFAADMYYYYCLSETVEALSAAQKEYKAALLTEDEDLIAAKKEELHFYESVITSASTIIDKFKTHDGLND